MYGSLNVPGRPVPGSFGRTVSGVAAAAVIAVWIAASNGVRCGETSAITL